MPLDREKLLDAVEENPETLFELLAKHARGARFQRTPHMRRMCFGVPVPFFNGVAMAKLTPDNCDEQIADAIGEMNGTGMPWSWQIGPSTTPFDLNIRLQNFGMRFSHETPLMAINLKNWKPSKLPGDFQVVPVDDVDANAKFTEVAGIAFGLPEVVLNVFVRAQAAIGFGSDAPLRNFLGFEDGEPACTGSVFYSHGIAGIYTIGTPPIYRGKGYGTAVTEACLLDAKNRGFDTAFLQSTKMGYPVYSKIGFRDVGKLSIYVPEEP